MTCLLNIYKHHHSPPTRNINRIILMFSLTNDLKITINGETKDLDNHIAIINQTDIYYVNQSSNLVTLSIPVFIFIMKIINSLNVTLTDIYCNQVVSLKILFYNLSIDL